MNKNILAVNTGKLVALALKLLNFGAGTSMPGLVAKKISPRILSHLVEQTKGDIINVTGTNGKTTTSSFIASILRSANRKVAHNSKGANMLTGIITAMLDNANCFAKLDIDNAVLETDEAFLQIVADYFTSDYLLVTNLFRDQLDRYGEVDATAKLIQKAIDKFKLHSYEKAHHLENPPLFTILLNADDPTIQTLADENTIFFGFDDIIYRQPHKQVELPEIQCQCGQNLFYSKHYYGHIGHYSCACGICRPETYLSATAEIFINYSILHLENKLTGEEFSIKVNLSGVYNAYNALAAITLAVKMGIDKSDIQKGFETYETVLGRAQTKIINGKKTVIQLIKNPVGAGEALQTVIDDKNAKILLVINDNYADGRDISWLWDVDFEGLQNHNKKIIVSGIRYADMAVRLKYAGVAPDDIILEKNIGKALKLALENTSEEEKLYVLPTYTALMQMQKFLK